MNRQNISRIAIDQVYNLISGFLYAAAICYFADGADFAPGGVTGIALILNHLFNLPIGTMTLVINIPMALIAYRFIGHRFLVRSLISVVYSTIFQDLVFVHIHDYTGDPVLASLFCGVLWGISLALLYMRSSSSGGSDFITLAIKKRLPHLSIGVVSGVLDIVVILLGWPVFGNIDSVLYGIITTFATSIVIDKIMIGSSTNKMLTIITTKGQEIADAISDEAQRGATLVNVTGAYTGLPRQMVLCACARPQVYPIRIAASEIDPNCMIMVSDTGEVYGEGFSSINGT